MNTNPFQSRTSTQSTAREIDQGLRSYMLGIYNHMSFGVAITGLLAYAIFTMAVTPNGQLTPFGATLYTSPLKWVFMFLPLGLSFLFGLKVHSMKASTARWVFYAYAASFGISLSSIFLVFTSTSIAQTFFITAAAFGALSLYGYTTGRNLSAFGSFLVMGMFGLLIASIVNIFLGSGLMQTVISAAGVLIFAGMTAWDTQKMKNLYYAGDTAEVAEKKSILGAYMLYTDFVALFMYLLQFLGNRE